MYEINRFRRLSHAVVHFVIDGASLITDQKKKKQVFQYVPSIRVSEQFESKLKTSLPLWPDSLSTKGRPQVQ